MLVLFDIDGTLLHSGGAGEAGFTAAGRQLYGQAFSLRDVALAGRLDPAIWSEAVAACDVAVDAAHQAHFRQQYAEHLESALRSGERVCRPLAGAIELVQRTAEEASLTCGVLTGNWPESGRLKLTFAGFDPDLFAVQAFAEDGVCRAELVSLAKAQWACGDDVTIIGDTPHDVACGKAHGCRTVAVTTGPYARMELESAGADLVVDDLSDVDFLLDWMASR